MSLHFKRHGFTLTKLAIVVVIVGIILAAVSASYYISKRDQAKKEAIVKEMAHSLLLAAEDFAVRNDGIYSDVGADLLPFLPGGQMLCNAFTGMPTEPHFGEPADEPGEVGIVATMLDGVAVGYTITAFGKTANILVLTSSL